MAHLAYFDESGDAGLVNSPTKFFVLCCVLIPENEWMNHLNALVELRQKVRSYAGVPTRPEIKATDPRRGQCALSGLRLSPAERFRIYRALMNYQARRMPGLKTFAIAIDKQGASARDREPREAAWTFALQRVDRFCIAGNSRAILFPDEGHGTFIKRLTRRLRRFQNIPGAFGGKLSIPIQRILEDPNDRQSHDSYFIQLADWNAFAAHRSPYVDPLPSCPNDMWDRLAGARLLDVNSVRGGPPGIVVYP